MCQTDNNGVIPSSYMMELRHDKGISSVAIKAGLLAEVGGMMSDAGLRGPVLLVSNPKVHSLYGQRLGNSLGRSGIPFEVFLMPDGEEHKNIKVATAIFEKALSARLDRHSAIVALGGGVVCDIAGFVAATYMRGIDFVQVPTTLLAQVDASVGGKVAVNLPSAKNVVGAFHQPRCVFIDTIVLATLEKREVNSGLAEIVKHGAALDAALFAELEAIEPDELADPEVMSQLVAWNVRTKLAVVEADERETGLRAVLNFGHTIGHAIESATSYLRFRHGEAVSIGMVSAAKLSAAMSLCPHSDVLRLEALMNRLGLITALSGLSAERLIDETQKDKKAIDGRPKFVLLESIGKARYGVEVPLELLREVLGGQGAQL